MITGSACCTTMTSTAVVRHNPFPGSYVGRLPRLEHLGWIVSSNEINHQKNKAWGAIPLSQDHFLKARQRGWLCHIEQTTEKKERKENGNPEGMKVVRRSSDHYVFFILGRETKYSAIHPEVRADTAEPPTGREQRGSLGAPPSHQCQNGRWLSPT